MKSKFGFSMVEIVIALVILAVGFFPVYNLFRQGSAGTANTVQETVATNYASDLINFCKDLRYTPLSTIGNIDDDTPYTDEKFQQIMDQYKDDTEESEGNKKIPNIDEDEARIFKRTITFYNFPPPTKSDEGKKSWWRKIIDKIKQKIGLSNNDDLFRTMPYGYNVIVEVQFPRGTGKLEEDKAKNDKVVFYTIIMD